MHKEIKSIYVSYLSTRKFVVAGLVLRNIDEFCRANSIIKKGIEDGRYK